MDKLNREYVLVCFRHKSQYLRDALLFWGQYTKNEEERSFGGYTIDIEKCEKYTYDEIKHEKYVYDRDIKKGGIPNIVDDIAIKVSDLEKIGYRKFTVYC